MKRFLQVILSAGLLMLLWTVLGPAPEVRAATQITSVSVYIDEPEVGKKPDYTPTLPSGAHYYSADYSAPAYLNDVAWFNETDGCFLEPEDGDTFKINCQYTVTIYLTPQAGYEFSEDAIVLVNGGWTTFEVDEYDGQLKIDYTFLELRAKITSVSVSITVPEAGAEPDWNPVFPSGAHYYSSKVYDSYNCKNDVFWDDLTDLTCMYTYDSYFEGAHQYKVTIYLTPEEGYEFANNVTATLNNETVECDFYYDQLKIVYTFPMILEEITSASITLTPPMAGAWADCTPELPSNAHYYSSDENDDTNCINDVYWFDITENFSMGIFLETFVTGHQYKVTVFLTPENGYAFTENTTAKFNGKNVPCEVMNKKLMVEYTFPKVTDSVISITTQPGAASVVEGKTATFKVVATGTGLSYQWEYKKPGESTWNKIVNNGTKATYSLTTAARHNGYTYRCKISNSAGTVTSKTAKLTVKPGITTQPSAVTVNAGKTATFKVVATGTGLTYQWQYKKPGESTWNNVSKNGTSAKYSLTAEVRHDGYTYRCKVTNSGGGYVYSGTAKLTVLSKPAVTTQPKAVSVVEGKTATFKVVATGGKLSYQWQYKKAGETTWNNVTNNGTSATYSLTTAARHNGYTYRCKISNSLGNVTSGTAKLTVKPGITTQPDVIFVNEGHPATFFIVATGTGLTYQWQYEKPGEAIWNDVKNNGTSSSYTLTAAARHNGYVYRCKVTNSGGGYVYSDSGKLIVITTPVITTQPANKSVTAGASATFKVVASGYNLTYQWYYKKPGESTWNAVVNNGTSATYTFTTAARHNGYQYKCVVKNSAGSVTSNIVKLTVK